MATAHTPDATPDVPVFFATTEGQTHQIAERLAAVLQAEGFSSRAIDVATPDASAIDWTRVRGALVGASIHVNVHQRAVGRFVSRQATALSARPSVFFSVSMAAASKSEQGRAAAQRLADAFPPAHGWTPWRIESVAGRLAYTQYGFLTRWMMKRIAKKEGGPTDTSRDHEFTDWAQVERIARDLAGELRRRIAA